MPRPPFRASLLLTLVFVISSITVPLPLAGAQGKVRMVLTMAPGTAAAEADALARATGAAVVGSIPQLNVRVVELPAAAVRNARAGWIADARVAGVETDGLVSVDWTPSDPLWAYQWEQRQVRAPRAWDLTRGAASTVVAVVDTGVQASHPDLAGQLVAGYDFVNDDRYPADDNGHGTAVAGVVAALASNGIGVAGGCPSCRVMPIKTMGEEGTGYWSVAAQGIVWAADNGADVINLSFGGPSGGSTLYNAIAYARAKGALVVASAGNSGSTQAFYPAAFDNVVSVAASTSLDLRYSWSNYSTSWVTMAAPGCTHATVRWNSYRSFCGTSAAAPVVSSVAALVESRRSALNDDEIEELLLASTVGTPYPFTRTGRIDAYAAVHRAAHGTAPSTVLLRPSSPLLAAGTRLAFASGAHYGYRFDTSGAIVGTRAMHLGADSGAETSKRQLIPDRSGYWFYVTNGGLAGYWIPESSRVYLAPAATPTPTPSPTPAPTPTPAPELLPAAPVWDPPQPIGFNSGDHTGYRFDTSGGVLATRPLRLSADSGARSSKRAGVPGRDGSWFYIINGGMAGYWVRESGRVYLQTPALGELLPSSPRLDPAQRVAFAAGDHLGQRFDTSGRLLTRRSLRLAAASGANTAKVARLPGRRGTWFYIVNGGMAGYWVRSSDRVYLLTDAPPSPSSARELLPPSPVFSPKQRLFFDAGRHTGYRFATDGSVLGRRRITLGAVSGASAVKRMRVPGQTGWWLYIVDGGLAGHWAREVDRRHLRP